MNCPHFSRCAAAILMLATLASTTSFAQVVTLIPGTSDTIIRSDAECVMKSTVTQDSSGQPFREEPVVVQKCDGNRAKVSIWSGNKLGRKTTITTSTRFEVDFEVAAVEGGESSFVPIQMILPVEWDGLLFNGNLVPTEVAGLEVLRPFATADVNSYFRIRDLQTEKAVHITRFQGASHGGISGCVSIPKSKVDVAKLVAKCVIAAFERDEGISRLDAMALVETGRSYRIELDLRANVYTRDPDTAPVEIRFKDALQQDRNLGLVWGDIKVTVGTDPSEAFADLEELRLLLEILKQDFEGHSHSYLTGKGVGHNNSEADTSTPDTPDLCANC